MTDTLSFQNLERAYDLIALAIDAAGPERESLFLGKLCLTLAHHINDISIIEQAIEIASADLQA
jgi:hypothetical protein